MIYHMYETGMDTMTPLQLFKCLSDDTRLKSVLIVSTLKEACVCDLMDALELDQPKVSRHLAELRGAERLLHSQKRDSSSTRMFPEQTS